MSWGRPLYIGTRLDSVVDTEEWWEVDKARAARRVDRKRRLAPRNDPEPDAGSAITVGSTGGRNASISTWQRV
jgi:hypothetical protein